MKSISKIFFLLSLFIFSLTFAIHAETDTYQIDPIHSSVWFRVLHLGISPTYGAFNDIFGSLQYNPNDPKSSSIEVIVKTASVNTLNEKRDEHLRSADFFNVEQFPEARFRSTSWELIRDNHYRIKGLLSLLGTEKPIEFEAQCIGIGKGRNGEERIGFETVFKIKRSDFGMTKYLPAQIGDEISITVGIEAEKKN